MPEIGKCLHLTTTLQPSNDHLTEKQSASDAAHFVSTSLSHAEKKTVISDWFDQSFWPVYGRILNKDKIRARSALLELMPDDELRAAILSGANMLADYRDYLRETGQFLENPPYAKSWIKGKRWTDVYDAPLFDRVPVEIDLDYRPSMVAISKLEAEGVPVAASEMHVSEFVIYQRELGRAGKTHYASARFVAFMRQKMAIYRQQGLAGVVTRYGTV